MNGVVEGAADELAEAVAGGPAIGSAAEAAARPAITATAKRIVVFCDGTWNRLDAACPTNVVKLALAVRPVSDRDRRVQCVFHLDGVGTGRGTGRLARALDRSLGGLFGLGLIETIAEAYRLIVFNYAPGDEILIFGYSRGAFTARSLAGMIRNAGILRRADAGLIAQAVALYRSEAEDDHPDGKNSLAFRARHSPDVMTSDGEREWRERHAGGDWSRAVDFRLAYLGVWDTVGSLGVPNTWTIAGLLNRRHQFHDTKLSSRVRAARHAVAVDERRRAFLPTLWDNTAKLNAERSAGGAAAPYQQRWFPGVHGAVGGGGTDSRLSDGALLWVLEGAEAAGLDIEPEMREAFAKGADPFGPLAASDTPVRSLRSRLLSWAPVHRDGPEGADGIAEPTAARWRGDPTYRPKTLDGVRPLLDAG